MSEELYKGLSKDLTNALANRNREIADLRSALSEAREVVREFYDRDWLHIAARLYGNSFGGGNRSLKARMTLLALVRRAAAWLTKGDSLVAASGKEGKMPAKKKHKAFCLLTDEQLEIVKSDATKVGMSLTKCLECRLIPNVKAKSKTIDTSWHSEGVSLVAKGMDWQTWKKLLGVVQIVEPEK